MKILWNTKGILFDKVLHIMRDYNPRKSIWKHNHEITRTPFTKNVHIYCRKVDSYCMTMHEFRKIQLTLQKVNLIMVNYPSYIHDLVPFNYYLFKNQKKTKRTIIPSDKCLKKQLISFWQARRNPFFHILNEL